MGQQLRHTHEGVCMPAVIPWNEVPRVPELFVKVPLSCRNFWLAPARLRERACTLQPNMMERLDKCKHGGPPRNPLALFRANLSGPCALRFRGRVGSGRSSCALQVNAEVNAWDCYVKEGIVLAAASGRNASWCATSCPAWRRPFLSPIIQHYVQHGSDGSDCKGFHALFFPGGQQLPRVDQQQPAASRCAHGHFQRVSHGRGGELPPFLANTGYRKALDGP